MKPTDNMRRAEGSVNQLRCEDEQRRPGDHFCRHHHLGGEAAFKAFLGASDDLIKNIIGVAPVAELEGDEVGFLVTKVADSNEKDWVEE